MKNPKSTKPITGADVRKARADRNIGIQMLADMLGVHRNTVSRWEAGAPIPGPAQVSLRWILNIIQTPDLMDHRRQPKTSSAIYRDAQR